MARGYESSLRSVEDLGPPPSTRPELILRIGEGVTAMDLDDLSRVMREASDQVERAKIRGRITAAFQDLSQEKQIEALRAVGIEIDFTVEVTGGEV